MHRVHQDTEYLYLFVTHNGFFGRVQVEAGPIKQVVYQDPAAWYLHKWLCWRLK